MKQQLAQITNPAINPSYGSGADGGSSFGLLIGNLYNTLIMLSGIALLLYLGWGGINWLTAGGDKAKVEAAKDRITNAIIGMVVVVAVVAIANLLSTVFGIDILNLSVPTP